MTKSIEDYHFDDSAYDRPNEEWSCGHSSAGRPCPIGPTGTGRCQADQICIPYLKQDRWQCNRPSVWGGKCTEGPLPDGSCSHPYPTCQPARSLMSRRRALTIALSSLTIGTLLLLLSREDGSRFASPGAVTAAHGHIEENCAACHSAGESVSDWVMRATRGGGGLADSRLCRDCHNMDPHALNPHGLPPAELAQITERRSADADEESSLSELLVDLVPDVHTADGELACATCHREHHGREFGLTHLDDRQCQSCHTRPFESFSHGHPDFGDYPHERRTRVRFDHSTHYGRHFALFDRLMRKGKAPASCSTCHATDDAGEMMLVRGFESACASCHATQIEDHGLPGVEFIRLATVDRQSLSDPELHIGEWPDLTAEDRGDLPPFLELLLSVDPEYRFARETLGDIPLGELDNADTDQLHAAATIVWSTKRLIHDLVERREEALEERLAEAFATGVDNTRLLALTGRPIHGPTFFEALTSAQQAWLPNLAAEMAERDGAEHEASPTGLQAVEDDPADNPLPERIGSDLDFGNWYLSARDQSLRFRPAGHADPLLTNWIQLIAEASGRRIRTSSSADGSGADVAPHADEFAPASAQAEAALSGMLGQMTDPETAGRCMKCHTLDRSNEGGLTVNWHGARPTALLRGFTRFSHAPHVTPLRGEEGCRGCHAVESEFDLLQWTFVNRDGSPNTSPHSSLTSGLRAVARQRCLECHTSARAGEGCLTCHNYHVGQFLPVAGPVR